MKKRMPEIPNEGGICSIRRHQYSWSECGWKIIVTWGL
jgi:hypothetical protein